MSKDKMTDAIGGIGDDLILEAKKNRSGIIMFRRIAVAAACMALLVGVFCLTFPKDEDGSIAPILQNTTAPTFTPTARPTTAPTTRPRPATVPTTNKPTGTATTPSSTSIMPTTSNQQPATPFLVITDKDQYNQLFLSADDASVFMQHQDFIATFGNQHALKSFVNKLQYLPIPHIEEAACTIMEYIPDQQMLNITLETPNNAGYSFTYQLSTDRASEILDDFANRNMIAVQEWTIMGCESFKTVTQFKSLYGDVIPGHYGCWMEINGWLANFSCNGLSGDVNLNSILAQLSIENTVHWN